MGDTPFPCTDTFYEPHFWLSRRLSAARKEYSRPAPLETVKTNNVANGENQGYSHSTKTKR